MSMVITASMVKELRAKTGAGMMDCKNALTETGGDTEKAIDFLRERGIAKAAGKAGRQTSEGLIVSRLTDDLKSGAVLEISCETDFVARTDDFQNFSSQLIEQALAEEPAANIDEFMSRPFAADSGQSVAEAVQTQIGKLGENMQLRRVEKLTAGDGGALSTYNHPGDKLAVLVEFSGVSDPSDDGFTRLARDIAMHIAAAAPQAVSREQLNQDAIEREREIYRQQAINEGKPEKIVDKIVNGKIDKYYGEVALLEQAFVKDPDTSVGDLLKSKAADIGQSLAVTRFTRYLLGG